MRPLRRLGYPLRLAAARLARRTGRFALVGLGLAAAAATLAAVLAGSLVAQDRSVAREMREIPAAERAVRAVWFGVPGESGASLDELDRVARSALAPVGVGEPATVLLFRRTSIGRQAVDLGAADGLAGLVRMRAGRLPRRCEPARCEVVRIRGAGPPPRAAGVEFVEVGRASLTSEVAFGRFVEPGTHHQAADPPLLLADGVETLADAPSLRGLYRSYAWVVPLAGDRLHAWDTDDFGGRVARARSELRTEDALFDLEAPVAQVETAGAAAEAAGRRLLLIGGEACALLVAFALLAAATLRRDAAAARRRLTWFGALRWQVEAGTAAETAAVAAAGTVAGWAGGAALAALVAREAGSPVGEVLRHSVASWGGLAAAAALALASALVLFAAVRARPVRVAGLAVSPVDVAALGALAVIVVALARGSADAETLAREGGTGALLLVLPGLVAFVAAVATARALVPVLRGLERLGRRSGVVLRLAALSLARNPGYAAVAIAFLTVSLGLALFAETYRSTLARGQAEQAAYAVPADAVVAEDLRELVAPLEAAPLAEYAAAARGGRATPIVRLSGTVPRLASARSVAVLGVPSGQLASVGGWRDDFAARRPAELAELVRPDGPARLAGPELPEDVREIRLAAEVAGAPFGLAASAVTPEGTFVRLDLGRTEGRRRLTFRAAVPAEARGGRIVGLTFEPPRRVEEGGASAGRGAVGVLTAGPLVVAGATGDREVGFEDWLPTSPGTSAIVAGPRTEFHYSLTASVVSRFRPRQASDEGPVPVLATPRLAAAAGSDGRLAVDLVGVTLTARVAGVVERFPSVDGEAVVGDRDLLSTAVNASDPGSAQPNEVWLDAPDGEEAALARRLAEPPFDVLQVTVRADVASGLRADPLARAALLTLASAAVVALALALVGLLLGVVSDLRDDRGELFDLEAQGAAPATLRRQVRLRAAIVAGAGLLGGIATGAILSLLVVDLVRLTANAARPQPPLLVAVDWPVVALAVGAYALAAVLLVGLATARAFRAPAPPRMSEVGA